jgi:pyrroline-5-carboxylate reductase
MSSQTFRLGFIGAGKLAGSVIRGLLLRKVLAPGEMVASQPVPELAGELRRETGIEVVSGNMEVAQQAEVVFVGVKPGVVLPVIEETAPALEGKLVVSFAAGIRLQNMEAKANARFLRVMTNTPSAIARGATAVAAGSRSTRADVTRVLEMFNRIGTAVEVEERHIDAVTALAGSGPAFVYTVIEALARGGEAEGLPQDIALTLATETAFGAAQLAAESGLSPEELRRMVITPGGTTAAGLAAMEKLQTSEGLIEAVKAASARGRELAAS